MNDLHKLAVLAHTGDARAVADLRQRLETQMVQIVRRAIGAGTGKTPLARQILAEAGRLAPRGWDCPSEDRERLIGNVARHLCDSVIRRIQPEPMSRHRPAMETVCN